MMITISGGHLAPLGYALQSEGSMTAQRLHVLLLLVLPLSVAGMVMGGAAHRLWLVVLSASAFNGFLVWTAIRTNAPYWSAAAPQHQDHAVVPLRQNTRMLAIAYAWGSFAMQALYTTQLTGLKWQHAWQYASIMAVMGGFALLFTRLLESENAGIRRIVLGIAPLLAIGHAMLAAGGLVFLAASGKLLVRRSDWAANQVFLFGALSVMILAAITLRTHARLTRH